MSRLSGGVVGGAEGSLAVWHLARPTSQPLVRLTGHQARVTGLDLGTDQQGHLLMVTGADDRRIIVWRLEM